MKTHLFITSLIFSGIASADPPTTAQRITGKRKMEVIEQPEEMKAAAKNYLESCESSTPLSVVVGSPPSSAILSFRHLVATCPITIIRLSKPITVDDKSGIKSEPPLKLISITVIEIESGELEVYTHTHDDGLLVRFSKPSKVAEDRLKGLIQGSQKAQQAAPRKR